MITIIKKLYFKLAGPLLRRVQSELDNRLSEQETTRVAHEQSIRYLHQELDFLRQRVEFQNLYIDNLRKSGLHRLLADYSVRNLRPPKTVIDALFDVASGVEPSAVAIKHRIPAHELNSWAESFAEANKPQSQNAEILTSKAIMQQDVNALLERQLEFNTRVHRDREEVSTLEIARLSEELALERQAPGRAVPVK